MLLDGIPRAETRTMCTLKRATFATSVPSNKNVVVDERTADSYRRFNCKDRQILAPRFAKKTFCLGTRFLCFSLHLLLPAFVHLCIRLICAFELFGHLQLLATVYSSNCALRPSFQNASEKLIYFSIHLCLRALVP